MKFLIILIFFESIQVQAELKKFDPIPDRQTSLMLDINKDGKIDRIEHRIGDRIVRIEEDKNFKGKINQWTSYFIFKNEKIPVEISEVDTNLDSKVDRKNFIYHDLKHRFRITTTEVDADFNGSFEKKFTTHASLREIKEQFNCADGQPYIDEPLISLFSDSTKASDGIFAGDFLKTKLGYDIQKSCMAKWGVGFPDILKDSIGTGLTCLQNLAKINIENKVNPNGAANNLASLKHLLQNQRPTIICDQKTSYDWNGTSAHASADLSSELKDDGIKHPYMSINPNDPKINNNATKSEIDELKKTIFHEQLHNLGIRHNEGIEIPYTCETCCLGDNDPKKMNEKKIACKICGGGYKDKNDKEYLKDYILWGKETYRKDRVSKAITDYQKEFPRDRFALFSYVDLNSGVFNPVALQVANIFKNKFPDLSEDEKNKFKAIEYIEKEKGLQQLHVVNYSKVVANALVANNYDHDPKVALAFLKTNKDMIKDLDLKIKSANEEDKWIMQDIRKKYFSLVKDIWMRSYPEELPEKIEAYDLLEELNYF